MSFQDVDPLLLLLRRQYMQVFEPDFLAWPPLKVLKNVDVQRWLYRHLFDTSRSCRLPPETYQMCVLKRLVAKIRKVIEDSEHDKLLDELMTCLASFMSRGISPEFEPARENAYVTFSCIPERDGANGDPDNTPEPTITLLERRHLISGSQTTGFRTWEASLHLGSYLLTETGSQLVRGKNVLELGAGTGFLSILSAKHLQANHLTITDGDGRVIDALRENLAINDLNTREKVRTDILTWGRALKGTWVEEDFANHPYDVVIGADITYNKVTISALVLTMQNLFDMRPGLAMVIGGVVRDAEMFQTFKVECARSHFLVKDIQFEPKPMRQQKALFYAAAVPMRILSISRLG
ncbi:putative methyltransferase-domain-containing protein [Hypoxylon sp. NC1633]|nr:putative methyltransferase-domain-containing protein [Hypoxylon sp. NC1633]